MRTLRRGSRLETAGALALAVIWALAPAVPAHADTIPAGFDLFETDPQSTHMDLALPAGFFGAGSDPYTGFVKFSGVPLGSFDGKNVGDADTIVQRKASVNPAPSDTVPIEIVALSLISVEPVTVTYNGGATSEVWDVKVDLSPSLPSVGQMTINKTKVNGGTFSTQLQIVPRLTFVSLSNAQTQTFDGADLPAAGLTLTGTGPWRTGCVLPALSVTGFNDGFCPGLTTTGLKRLTTLQAAIVSHGIRPAQHAQEHFKCYSLKRSAFDTREVTLTDVFGSRSAKVTSRDELCNPAQKNTEPYRNKRAHLVCYATAGVDPEVEVAVRNQFGAQRLLVRQARRLCVPSQKRKLTESFKQIQFPIDHQECYAVDELGPLQRYGAIGPVTLTDQFGVEVVNIGAPIQLCVPVQKDDSKIKHTVHAAVCYSIADTPVQVRVEIKNQFEQKKITTVSPVLVCVPTAEVMVPP